MFIFASPMFLLLLLAAALILFLKLIEKKSSHIKVSSLKGLENTSYSFMVTLSKLVPILKISGLIFLILVQALKELP